MSAPKKVRSMFATAALLISFGAAATQPIVDVGRLEYEGACAVCHGSTGKGDGGKHPAKPPSPSRLGH